MIRPEQDIYKRLERFKKVDAVTGCWLWIGCTSKSGYGQIQYKHKKIRIHRLSAHLFLEFDLNSNLIIRHKSICPNKNCWNPDHIIPGTNKDNSKDYSESITHCPKGHEYTPENTYYRQPLMNDNRLGHGGKSCRECRKLAAQVRRQIA